MTDLTTRRAFFRHLGKLASIGAVTPHLDSALAGRAEATAVPPSPEERVRKSFEIRKDCALQQLKTPFPPQIANGDERRYPNFIGNYSKGLPHNELGEVDQDGYRLLLDAVATGTSDAFEKVPLGGTTRLANPLAGLAFDLEGADSHSFSIPEAPALASKGRASEMIELYWMALCRDANFSDYGSNPITRDAAEELSSLEDFRGSRASGAVNPQMLFRGFTSDDVLGPYVSQLFQIPFSYGNFLLSGQVTTHQPETDYLVSHNKWLDCQNGLGPFSPNPLDPQPRYYRNGRDLAAYVHFDRICEAFYNAALRLYDVGAPPNPANPYVRLKAQSPFATFGQPHFLTMHGEFALRALKAAWYQKWFVHRTLRPEAYGGLVQGFSKRAGKLPDSR